MNRRSSQDRLFLVGYGVLAGIVASAVGALVSTAAPDEARAWIWMAVTLILALVFAWSASAAAAFLGRLLRQGGGRGSLPR